MKTRPTSTTLLAALASLLLVGGTAAAADPPAGAAPDTAASKAPAGPGDVILGYWYTTDGPAKIQVYKCEEKYCGKIVWLENPLVDGKPALDANNSNQELRSRPILGIPVLTDYTYDTSKQQWTGGVAYSPDRGHEYNAVLSLDGDNLKITVKVGPVHKSEEWTRTTAPEEDAKETKETEAPAKKSGQD